jgi:hypothetical protein
MFDPPAPPNFLPPPAAVKSETTVAAIRQELKDADVASDVTMQRISQEPGPSRNEPSVIAPDSSWKNDVGAASNAAATDDPAPAHDAALTETSENVEATTTAPRPPSFLVQVTVSKGTHDKLRLAQALLSHAVSPRDVAQVLDRALDALIEKLEKRKFGKRSH